MKNRWDVEPPNSTKADAIAYAVYLKQLRAALAPAGEDDELCIQNDEVCIKNDEFGINMMNARTCR